MTYKKAELFVVKDPDVDDEETGWGFHLANQMSFMDADDDGTAKTVGHIVHWVEKGGPGKIHFNLKYLRIDKIY